MKSLEYLWSDRRRRLGLPLSLTRYSLSEDRLFLETGLLSTRCEEILLYRVRDLSMKISLGQRIFGVGTVTVQSWINPALFWSFGTSSIPVRPRRSSIRQWNR